MLRGVRQHSLLTCDGCISIAMRSSRSPKAFKLYRQALRTSCKLGVCQTAA